MAGDPFNLQRFVDAQAGGVYEQALGEIEAGEKRSHWMWFRRRCEQSPGLSALAPSPTRDLGRSPTAKFYGLSGEEEARAYLAHPVLGPRYREAVAAVRTQLDAAPSTSSGQARLEAIFGELDAMKFRSSVEMFGVDQPWERPDLDAAFEHRRSFCFRRAKTLREPFVKSVL